MPPGNNCPSGRGAKAALVERRDGLLLPMKMRVILEEKTDAVLALILLGLSGSVALGAHGWRGLVRYSHRLAGAGLVEVEGSRLLRSGLSWHDSFDSGLWP